ncbi:MAG: hypothetical protein ACK52S_04725, partial [Pirellula sp.]
MRSSNPPATKIQRQMAREKKCHCAGRCSMRRNRRRRTQLLLAALFAGHFALGRAEAQSPSQF